jgi:bifunctional enzyme CysN/CysC
MPSLLLDGDLLRSGLNADLGFSDEDRNESVRRAGEVALLLASAGTLAIVSLVSPLRAARDEVRRRHELAGVPFLEVFVAAPLEVCEARDPKGLYARARRGEVAAMTGIDSPYEPPRNPEVTLHSERDDAATCVAAVLAALASLPQA